jgi:peroxiredoxin Q/BCP
VLGVSPDTVSELSDFADKHGLPFTLLSDEDHEVAERYGVWVRSRASRLSLPRWGNERTTFVIGPDGVVQSVLRKVDPRAHDSLVLGEIAG